MGPCNCKINAKKPALLNYKELRFIDLPLRFTLSRSRHFTQKYVVLLFIPTKEASSIKNTSFCSQTRGKAETPRHLVMTAWQETLSFSLFLTIISSFFSMKLVFFPPLLVSAIAIQSRALSWSFFLCSSVQLSLFSRALSPTVCNWHSACLLVPFLVLSLAVCHWYSANE